MLAAETVCTWFAVIDVENITVRSLFLNIFASLLLTVLALLKICFLWGICIFRTKIGEGFSKFVGEPTTQFVGFLNFKGHSRKPCPL